MRIIQIGVGHFGAHWLRTLKEYPGIEIAALVDIDKKILAEAADFVGISKQFCFQDLQKAIDAAAADALICISPPSFHRQHVTMAMNAGLDVICEKPVAVKLEDAVAMARTSKETGRIMAVSQNYRYRPITWTMRKLIADGEIGEIGQIALDFYKGWFFETTNFRQSMAHPLLSDMGIHHFDLLRFVTGLEAASVHGESWNPPWSQNSGDTSVSLIFTLTNGTRFVYSASWCAQGDFTDWNGNWLVEGDRGSVHYRDGILTLNHASPRYEVEDSQTVRQVGPPMLDQAFVLADFMAARQERRMPRTSIFDNLCSFAMVAAARDAVDTGQTTPVPSYETLMA